MSALLAPISDPARWYAIATRGGVERQVFDRLRHDGQRVFWPRYLWDGRTVPLFPTYLFQQAPTPADTSACLSVPGVVRVLGNEVPTPVRRGELERLIDLAEADQVIDVDKLLGRIPRPTGHHFQQGDEIRVSEGVFQGFAAIVLRGKARAGRIQIALRSGDREVEIKIAEASCQLIDDDERLPAAARQSTKQPFDRYDKAVRRGTRA
jgi:transcription antitermination factor NusG